MFAQKTTMAVLDKKEQKIQAVLGRLPKKYTDVDFVEMFIKLYSKDWGKIKSAYVKQNQDKEPGTVVNMPKPELYLKQLLTIYLNNAAKNEKASVEVKATQVQEIAVEEKAAAKVVKPKAIAKKVKESEAVKEGKKSPVKVTKLKTAAAKETSQTTVSKKETEAVPEKVEKKATVKVAKPKAAVKKSTEVEVVKKEKAPKKITKD